MEYDTQLPSYTSVYEIQRDKLATYNRGKTAATHAASVTPRNKSYSPDDCGSD